MRGKQKWGFVIENHEMDDLGVPPFQETHPMMISVSFSQTKRDISISTQAPRIGIKAGIAPLHPSQHPEMRIERCRAARAPVILRCGEPMYLQICRCIDVTGSSRI